MKKVLPLLLALTACASTPAENEPASFLLVQSAERATLTDSTLTLGGVGATTTYFSDRPKRIVGHAPTSAMLKEWSKGDDSFAKDPPNATLSIFDGEGVTDIVLVLDRPRVQGADLVYDVKILSGAPDSGGPCSLFIDNLVDPFGTPAARGPMREYPLPRRPVQSTLPFGH